MGTGLRGKAGGTDNRFSHTKDNASCGGVGVGVDDDRWPDSSQHSSITRGQGAGLGRGRDSHGALASLGILPCTETAGADAFDGMGDSLSDRQGGSQPQRRGSYQNPASASAAAASLTRSLSDTFLFKKVTIASLHTTPLHT